VKYKKECYISNPIFIFIFVEFWAMTIISNYIMMV
jgi:hypothetical protein